jgi:pyruvate dehydrogenase E2 component (dihydrolipoamide acetyltransferase)
MIALEKGIPLKDVKGSGPNGRIVKRDVENWKPAAAPAAAPAASPAAAAPAGAIYEDIPITMMRKTIANRLTESKRINPDYIVSSTVSVSKLQKLRQSLNASSNGEFKLSINDILIKAIAIASQRVPQVNSHWLENEGVIRQYKNVDVSVAVATPTGLITPVVKNAHAKGLVAISKEAKELGKKARDGKLTPEEYQGGTITISNMGMNHAVSLFTAIINPPQAAILAVGTVERRAIEDPESETGVAFDDVMALTASFDHKVVDGAVGGEWIKALKQVIENPLELML